MERGSHPSRPLGEAITDPWLLRYMQLAAETESPTLYHPWLWLWVLSAVVGRRVYHTWGHQTLYGNLYIVIVGPSGVRKGTALDLATKTLLLPLGIEPAPDDTTPQALVSWLREQTTVYQDASGKSHEHTVGVVASEEMYVFLGEGNTQFLASLAALYDGRERPFGKATIKRKLERLVNPYLTAVWLTAPDWMPHIFPAEVIGGGFNARCINVVAWEKARIIDYEPSPPDEIIVQELLDHLRQVRFLVGQARFSQGALRLYRETYREQERLKREGNLPSGPRLDSYIERRQVHMRKIAMLFAAGELTLEVGEHHMAQALALLRLTERDMAGAFAGLGRNKQAEMEFKVREYIRRKGKATRSDLLRAFAGDVDAATLAAIMDTLTSAELVASSSAARGWSYSWKGEPDDNSF